VIFSNTYFMGGNITAVCDPSRAMLMTGKSLFHIGDNISLNGVTTIPEYFKEHGYVTFGTGKWHNGAKSFERSFDEAKNVFIGGMCDHFNVSCRDMGTDKTLGSSTSKGYSTDVFSDSVISSAIVLLREMSVAQKSKPVEFPDFTKGKWKTQAPIDFDNM